MPITDYSFEAGIFFARETGDLSAEDATQWAEALERCAAASPTPIAVVVDALEVGYSHEAAHDIFARASFTTNVRCIAVAVPALNDATARVIGLMGKFGQTRVFETLEEARAYALRMLESGRTG